MQPDRNDPPAAAEPQPLPQPLHQPMPRLAPQPVPQPLAPPRIAASADIDDRARIGDGTSIWHLAQVRENATLGENCNIGRGAYVGPGVVLGDNVKLQNYALVYEPAVLGDGVFIGPAAVLTNDEFPRAVTPEGRLKTGEDWHAVGVTIGEGAAIGARAVCVAPVHIGRWALVAAGAVVTKDVPDFALVVGVPARRTGWVGRAGVPLIAKDATAKDQTDEDATARDATATDVTAKDAIDEGTTGDGVSGGREARFVCPRTGTEYVERDGVLTEAD